MSDTPLANGSNGERGPDGRFLPGNSGGPGNPHPRRTAQFMAELRQAVSAEDFAEIVAVLVARAKAGESWAIREVLDRLCGKPVAAPATVDEGDDFDDGSASRYGGRVPEAHRRELAALIERVRAAQ